MLSANRLKVILDIKNLSQDHLSRGMKIAPANVSRWCRNESQPSQEMLYRISLFLNVRQQDLLYKTMHQISIPLMTPPQEVDLAQLGVEDAFLRRINGKNLLNFNGAIIQLLATFGSGTFKGRSIPLIAPLNQNPNIPLIEAREIIVDCTKTKLTLINCKEPVELWFLLP